MMVAHVRSFFRVNFCIFRVVLGRFQTLFLESVFFLIAEYALSSMRLVHSELRAAFMFQYKGRNRVPTVGNPSYII